MISMLTGLKRSSLVCKCVKGVPILMELNFEGFEMQKLNIPTDGAQRVDKKIGVVCLVVMFTPRVTVINKSKMAHFCIFCWW